MLNTSSSNQKSVFVRLRNFQQHLLAFGYGLMYFRSGVYYCGLHMGAAYIKGCFSRLSC